MYYHDAYRDDVKNKSARRQTALRQEALNELRAALSKTHTLLSHLARTFLSSMLLLLITMPVLQLFTEYPVMWVGVIMAIDCLAFTTSKEESVYSPFARLLFA